MKHTKFSDQRIETLVNQATKIKEQIVTSNVDATAGDRACWTAVTGCQGWREEEREIAGGRGEEGRKPREIEPAKEATRAGPARVRALFQHGRR